MESPVHYRIKTEQVAEPTGYASAAIRSCMCCGIMLSGMGGGGDYICKSCFVLMHSGQMGEALTAFNKLAAANQRIKELEEALMKLHDSDLDRYQFVVVQQTLSKEAP